MDLQLVVGTLGALLAVLAVIVVPGLPLVPVLRLRGWLLVAALPALSLTTIALGAELGHLLHVDWSLLVPLTVGVGAAGLLLGARQLRDRWRGDPPRHLAAPHDAGPGGPRTPLLTRDRVVPAAGFVLGSLFLLLRQLRHMGSVDAVTQTFDGIFHLNAVRHILRHHDASATVVGSMTRMPGQEGYYPSLWHQAASLVAQLSGQDIVLATDVLLIVVGCLLWPLGMMALVGSATTAGPVGVALAGALAGVSAAFPLALMSWGLLLPYLLAIVLLPTVLLGAAHLLLLSPLERRPGALPLAAVLVSGCAAVLLAHPQGALAAIVLGVPLTIVALGVRIGERIRGVVTSLRPVLIALACVVASLGIGLMAWSVARPSRAASAWDPNATPGEAAWQVISLAPNKGTSWWPVALVMVAAILAVLLLTRSRWLIAPWLLAGVASVLVRSQPEGDLRYLLTGPFYSDNNRLAALPVVLAVPLLAVGLEALGTHLERFLRGHRLVLVPRVRTAVVALVAPLLLLTAWAAPGSAGVERYYADQWQKHDLLDDDERALLEEVPEHVPEDAVIAVNPWNGGSLAYAISDREVNVYVGRQKTTPQLTLIKDRLDPAATDPEVCDAMHAAHVEYALDFGPHELWDRHETMPGLDGISRSGATEVVAREGDATLLRMLPCRGTDGSMTG